MEKEAKILVLDEPTASLSDAETKYLFKMMRDLQKKGVSMIYISHRMNEIMEIADRISILRDGKNRAHRPDRRYYAGRDHHPYDG